jgi:hypothetical protein
MSNQIIGIACAFALTLFLFGVRYWFFSRGRHNGKRYVNHEDLNER